MKKIQKKGAGKSLESCWASMLMTGSFTSGATESPEHSAVWTGLRRRGAWNPATQTEHNSVLRPLMNQPVLKKHPVTIISCLENGAVTRKALEKGLEEALENTGKKSVSSYCKPLFQCDRICAGYEADLKFCKRK